MSAKTAAGPAGGRVWIDGVVVDVAAARVPVTDRGFLYGDSVYEVTRTYDGRPSSLAAHLDRLAESARLIDLALPPRDLVVAAVHETAAAVSSQRAGTECYLRIVVTRGSGALGLDPALADGPRLVVVALPLVLPDEALYAHGAPVVIATHARRNAPGGVDPLIKSGNYLSSVLAVAEARAQGGYEALLCDVAGRISEGSSSNVFVVRAGMLATPPLSVGILHGITRRLVLELARGLGISVEETHLWPLDLARADEAFLTSSVRGVMPIASVDGVAIAGAPGPITLRLRAAYEDTARTA